MKYIPNQLKSICTTPIFFIIFSLSLIIISLIAIYKSTSLQEGMDDEGSDGSEFNDYSDEEASNPMFLAMKNASNISVMKAQLDEMKGIGKRITDVETKVDTNEESIQTMAEQVSNGGFASMGIAPEDVTDPENIPVIDGL
jgi:hypothetical protein